MGFVLNGIAVNVNVGSRMTSFESVRCIKGFLVHNYITSPSGLLASKRVFGPQSRTFASRPQFQGRQGRYQVQDYAQENQSRIYNAVEAPAEADEERKAAKEALLQQLEDIKMYDRSEQRIAVEEAVTDLLPFNPNPYPTDEMYRLTGKWYFLWTSDPRLKALFRASDTLKSFGIVLEIADIYLDINGEQNSAEAVLPVTLLGGAVKFSFRLSVSFDKETGKRLQETYVKGTVLDGFITTSTQIGDSLPAPIPPVVVSQLRQIGSELLSRLESIIRPLEVPLGAAGNSYKERLLLAYVDENLIISRRGPYGLDILYKRPDPEEVYYEGISVEEQAADDAVDAALAVDNLDKPLETPSLKDVLDYDS